MPLVVVLARVVVSMRDVGYLMVLGVAIMDIAIRIVGL